MTRERALWEAVATVAIPSLIIWGALFYTISDNARADEWPLYLIFVAMPLPLIFPIYKRYLRGPSVKLESPRTLFILAAGSALLGSSYIISALRSHRDSSDLVIHFAMGIGWLTIGAEKLRRAVKARANLAK
jgi:hypothetical protein